MNETQERIYSCVRKLTDAYRLKNCKLVVNARLRDIAKLLAEEKGTYDWRSQIGETEDIVQRSIGIKISYISER